LDVLIKNIKTLAGIDYTEKKKLTGEEMSVLNCIDDAFLLMENDTIKDFGKMSELRIPDIALETINAERKFVLPSWCDSHTHLVFASSREKEFEDRINGLTYEDVAKRGGGILNSVKKLGEASEEELYDSTWNRLDEIMMQGTGSAEIKSGYGLSVENELKILRVIKKLKQNHPLTIKATFLGAHAVPSDSTKDKYVDLIINEMLPRVAEEKLADYCDVFCERNYFSKEDTVRILVASNKLEMKGKVHAEQLSHSGGIEAGVQCNAISVDHLEFADDNDIALLKNSKTMATLLPGAQFFLQLQYPPARKMIEAGLSVAIASDYNPGSAPSGNMNLNVALACIQYRMTPEEAINAATLNSAYAMGLSDTHGSIKKGKKANVIITKKIPSLAYLPYSFGSNLIETVIINGKVQTTNNR
jgi:imidazolonepropionase